MPVDHDELEQLCQYPTLWSPERIDKLVHGYLDLKRRTENATRECDEILEGNAPKTAKRVVRRVKVAYEKHPWKKEGF